MESFCKIQCGVRDPNPLGAKNYIYRMFIDFFNREVEVFQLATTSSEDEPTSDELYFRGSDLGRRIGISTNAFAMFLKRKRKQMKGIYQASGFVNKAPHSFGLKYGSYFVSYTACLKIHSQFEDATTTDHFPTHQNLKSPIAAAPVEARVISFISDEEKTIQSPEEQDMKATTSGSYYYFHTSNHTEQQQQQQQQQQQVQDLWVPPFTTTPASQNLPYEYYSYSSSWTVPPTVESSPAPAYLDPSAYAQPMQTTTSIHPNSTMSLQQPMILTPSYQGVPMISCLNSNGVPFVIYQCLANEKPYS